MSGVAGDNATRYLLTQKGVEAPNDENIFQLTAGRTPDFVWNGSCVRYHGEFSSGGHPALAGMQSIYCAGVIKKGYFFFHSGHYHPTLIHALHFFCDFVSNTCSALGGAARDRKVNELCGIVLKLYVDDSETKTYMTTFSRVAAPDVVEVMPSSSGRIGTAPMSIGQPMLMSKPQRSAPMSIGMPVSTAPSSSNANTSSHFSSMQEPSNSLVALEQEVGINAYGKHQLQVRVLGAPPWIDDSARTKCALCKSTFGTFNRKHHCRRCGEIVCGDCSKHTMNVAHPATKPSQAQPEKQPVRVCNLCYSTQNLI